MINEKTAETASAPNPSPKEVHERLERYLKDTEALVAWLQEGLSKGEEQLRAIKTFDEKISQIGGGIEPIETGSVEAEIENIRKHILSLEELRERVKGDIAKVERISAKIAEILNQYQGQS